MAYMGAFPGGPKAHLGDEEEQSLVRCLAGHPEVHFLAEILIGGRIGGK